MTEATKKQIIALKKFAKNKEIYDGYLKGVNFDDLSKEQASELIKKCYDYENGASYEDGGLSEGSAGDAEFRLRFSQNYRNGDGRFATVALTDDELAEIRAAHKKHCQEIMEDCEEDYPDDRELQLAMFEKRADKIFTWIQQALDEKVRRCRE